MTARPRSSSAVDTEPITVPPPSSGRADTLEIPVTPSAGGAPRSADPAAPVPVQATAATPPPPVTPPRGRGRAPGAGTVAGVALLAAAAGVLAGGLGVAGLGGTVLDRAGLDLGALVPGRADVDGSVQAEPGGELEPVSVTSVDPSGGSGFQARDGGGWRTQTYRSAEFGNLKEGVGLLVDLGTARELSAVSLTGATSGVSVELRASDAAAETARGSSVVDTAQTSGEVTVLEAGDAEAARYWLVWVTELAPVGDGFGAEIGDLELQARS